MASDISKLAKTFSEAFRESRKSGTSAYDTQATVVRTEGTTAWVHIPGGVDETPVRMTMDAKLGDEVQVRISGGRAWITGNATAPPTDDRTAVAATVVAQTAQQAADTVSAKVAVIEKAYITKATVETLLADYASINYLEASYATITELHTGYAQINLANIDTANISKASIKDLFTEVGLIASATIVDGKITGYLDAVNVNAANITAGTLVADRIAIRGSNSSLVYALNNYGQITSTQVNTLDGYVLTPRTINADKIVAGTITATEIAASTITANKLNVSTLSSVAADIGTVTAGVLKSTDYSYTSGTYTAAGMIIDLTNKVIRMPNTAILSDGSLYTKSGEIGGFAITDTRLYSPVTIGTKTYRANIQSMGNETDPARLAFYVAIDENGSSTYPFRVNYAGTLFTSDVQATGGKIGGFAIDSTSLHTENVPVTSNAESSLALSSSTFTRTIGGSSRSNLKFAIGDSFGITKSGQIYAGATMILDTVTSTSGRTSLAGIEMQYEGSAVGGLVGSVIPSSDPYKELRLYTPNHLQIYAGEGIIADSTLRTTSGLGVGKSAQQAAAAGFWANNAGNVYLTGDTDTGSYIYFYYNKATSATSYIREESSNHLYTNAYFRPKLYNGTVGQVVGSVPTDGNRIAYFSSNSTTLFINGQHGTTGSTFANKSIAFSTSDIRLKTNIEDAGIEALPIVNRMKVRTFDWTDGRKDIHQSIGVVADELEKIDRRLSVGGGYAEDGSMNYKSVDTLYLCGYLLKAIQELSAEVKALKGVA